MNVDQFVQQRQTHWQRLELLISRSQDKAYTLPEHELEELGRLYRQATSDLALAQRDFGGHRVGGYLNRLVGQTHALIYQGEPLTRRGLVRFFTESFPRLYRHILSYTTVAFLLFLLPALVGFGVVWQQPDAIYVLLGPGISDLVHTVEAGEMWTEIAPTVRATASTAIMTNNIRVSFLAYAGSMTGGLLTLYVLIFNGLNIGAIFGLLQAHGMSGGLAEFITAHGFIELSVIFLAGGCGLYVGDGLVRPGLLARRDALVRRGRETVALILGCIPLLILAGLIEGFLSPSGLHWGIKLGVGLVTGVLLHGYWLRMAREGAHPASVE